LKDLVLKETEIEVIEEDVIDPLAEIDVPQRNALIVARKAIGLENAKKETGSKCIFMLLQCIFNLCVLLGIAVTVVESVVTLSVSALVILLVQEARVDQEIVVMSVVEIDLVPSLAANLYLDQYPVLDLDLDQYPVPVLFLVRYLVLLFR
jgi:hypothetical protein